MLADFAKQLELTRREVTARDGGERFAVVMTRTFDAEPDDVWEALTDPDRLKRWFLPVSGDLQVGGSFQLEGHAGGTILTCEPPRLLRVTFGDETSFVEVRLTPEGGGTEFVLDHEVPTAMAGSGAGAFFVGPGWDGAIVGLGLYLRGEVADDPAAVAASIEAQQLAHRSSHLWVPAVEASGTATAEQIAEGLATAVGHYAPDVNDDGTPRSTD